jgi:hypothetical protein
MILFIFRCLSGMMLMERCPSITHEIIYSFEKKTLMKTAGSITRSDDLSDLPEKSLFEFQFDVGDPVVVSTEQGHLALAIGHVREISHHQLVLTLDRELRGPPARKSSSDDNNYIAIDDPSTCPETQRERGILYRIDKDEISSSIGLVRWSLIRLITTPTCHRLRNLVIDLSPPEYRSDPDMTSLLDGIRKSGLSLNVDQEDALRKVLTGNDGPSFRCSHSRHAIDSSSFRTCRRITFSWLSNGF